MTALARERAIIGKESRNSEEESSVEEGSGSEGEDREKILERGSNREKQQREKSLSTLIMI